MVVGAWGWSHTHLGGVAVRGEHLGLNIGLPALGVNRRGLHRDLHPPVQQHVECAAHVALLVEVELPDSLDRLANDVSDVLQNALSSEYALRGTRRAGGCI